MLRFDDLQIFVAAADLGSFSAAARQADVTPAWASNAVQRLEAALGARLFVRSTRSMRLSDDGERYLPHARSCLAALSCGKDALSQANAQLSGALRLSAPSDLGRNVLLPWLDEFQQAHPQISVQLRISDQIADFFREPLDAGLRYGVLVDSNLVSLPVAPDNRRSLCAAPSYLQRHGVPSTPADLAGHNCLRYVIDERTHERWAFHVPGGVQTVTVAGDRISDDADIVRRWALAGRGLVYKSRMDLAEDLAAGRLVEIFPRAYGEPAPLQLVCAHRSSMTPAIQQLRAFLSSRCEALGTAE